MFDSADIALFHGAQIARKDALRLEAIAEAALAKVDFNIFYALSLQVSSLRRSADTALRLTKLRL